MTPAEILAAADADQITDELIIEDLILNHAATDLLIAAIDNVAVFHNWLHDQA